MHEVGRVVYGSMNYGLNGPDSDKDYKVFLCPNFNDLYDCHKADSGDLRSKDSNGNELSPMDVRRFNQLCVAGNVNVTEYLFSVETYMSSEFWAYYGAAKRLYENGYLALVWDKWFASLEGLVKNSLDRYDANRKSMSRAYYFYLLATTLVAEDFRMNDNTWRKNNWNNTVKEMRFNPATWMPTREELFKSLSAVKETGKNRMKLLLENKEEYYRKLKEDADNLDKLAHTFVANELKYEFLTEE